MGLKLRTESPALPAADLADGRYTLGILPEWIRLIIPEDADVQGAILPAELMGTKTVLSIEQIGDTA